MTKWFLHDQIGPNKNSASFQGRKVAYPADRDPRNDGRRTAAGGGPVSYCLETRNLYKHFAGVVALMKLFERQFAVLRALGASRLYIFVAVWLFASLIVAGGALLGLGVGYGVAAVGSSIIAEASGMTLHATLGMQEVWLALAGTGAGIVLATLPAALLYRGSVASILR